MAVASTPLVAAPSCPAWAKHRRGRQPQRRTCGCAWPTAARAAPPTEAPGDSRSAPAVAKTVRPQRGQCGCPAHAVCGMCVDQGKLAAAEQAAIDLETRFHASTNVVMDLERPEDETAALLQRCVHVSDETKRRLLGEWSDERMAHALPLHACASC
ncbi:hypothetical protein EMIHUDRAFT_374391, partial [Emiliania huxleyi CCMP1516]|uniref:Uncharacterized protein n=2 Tax=Emiliania huxleyi TaxID=2903 RepID=A0A0D3IEL8_EMIH1